MLLSLLLMALPAGAYETDQLTDRDLPLADAAPALDAWMTRMLVNAVAETNSRTACQGSDRRVHLVLASSIHRRAASGIHLSDRGLVKGMGYDQVMAFLEESPVVELRTFPERRDIYGLATVGEAPIMAAAGVSGTMLLDGVLMGTDKPSHFVDLGYHYFRHSQEGRDPDRAVDYGTNTERSIYGSMTSSSFSFADLRANWDGYLFYLGLLEPGSPVQRAEDGCLDIVAPFRWEDWVDWEYDEALNPPVLTDGAQEAVDRRLELDRDHYCHQYAELGPELYDAFVAESLTEPRPYYGDKAPERTDTFGLAELCEDWEPMGELQPTTTRNAWGGR